MRKTPDSAGFIWLQRCRNADSWGPPLSVTVTLPSSFTINITVWINASNSNIRVYWFIRPPNESHHWRVLIGGGGLSRCFEGSVEIPSLKWRWELAGWTLTLDLCLHFLWVSELLHKVLLAGLCCIESRQRTVEHPGAASWMLRRCWDVIMSSGHFLPSHSLFAYITATLPWPPRRASRTFIRKSVLHNPSPWLILSSPVWLVTRMEKMIGKKLNKQKQNNFFDKMKIFSFF